MPVLNARSILARPLAQFVLVAAVAFGVHAARRGRHETPSPAVVSTHGPLADRRIDVTPELIAAARETLRRQRGTEPTDAELRTEIDRFVDEEVLYREALAAGLDRGDAIVRRRLVQKMEFVVTDETAVPPPGDEALRVFAAAHADRYRTPGRVSFVHVFVRSAPGTDAARRAGVLLASLRAGASRASMGDPFPLGSELDGLTLDAVDAHFGGTFAQALARAPLDTWSGPFASRFGEHLVRVSRRFDAEVPPLESIRARVSADLLEVLRARANRAALDTLRRRYDVHVRGLSAGDGGVP